MRNNLDYFNKEVVKPTIISKFLFFNLSSIPKIKRCIFSIYLSDVNKFNILFSFIFFKFFLIYKKPNILNKSKRFPKKRIVYKKNNDLNFLINLDLINTKKIYLFLEFFLIIFLFSRFRKYCNKRVNNFSLNILMFQHLDFLFFNKYLKSFFKFSNEAFFIIKKMRLSLMVYYISLNNSKLKSCYFKLLKFNK